MGCGGSKEEVATGNNTTNTQKLFDKKPSSSSINTSSKSPQTSTTVSEIDVKVIDEEALKTTLEKDKSSASHANIDEKRVSNESMDQYFSPSRDEVNEDISIKGEEEDKIEEIKDGVEENDEKMKKV